MYIYVWKCCFHHLKHIAAFVMISFGVFLLENLALGSCSLETCQEGGFSEKVGTCWLQSYTGSYFRYWTAPHAKYRGQSYVWDTAVFITVGRLLILMMITVFPCEFLLFQMSQFGQGSFCSALLLGTEMSPRCISGGRGQRVGVSEWEQRWCHCPFFRHFWDAPETFPPFSGN